MANHIATLVEKFGGTRRMARVLRTPSSTVNNWKKTGVIPQKHWQPIIAGARRYGIAVEPAELVGPIRAGD